MENNFATIAARLDNFAKRIQILETTEIPGNFTPSGVLFANASGVLKQDSLFVWNDTSNRLGIGTNAPTQALHVVGSGRFSSAVLIDSLTTGSVLFAGANGAISQDNSNLFWDDTNNRLGLGITAPSGFIHIKFTGGSKIGMVVEDNTANSDTLIKLINPDNIIGAGSYFIRAIKGNTDQFIARGDGYVQAESQIASHGSTAGLVFYDRSGSNTWQWYGTSDIARLYDGTTDSLMTDGIFTYLNMAGDTGTTNQTETRLYHRTSGTPAANFGHQIVFVLHSANNTDRTGSVIQTLWTTATDASRASEMRFFVSDASANREFFRGGASGTAPKIGFLGTASAAKQTVTGSRGGNAALASLLTALATYGLITDSSS